MRKTVLLFLLALLPLSFMAPTAASAQSRLEANNVKFQAGIGPYFWGSAYYGSFGITPYLYGNLQIGLQQLGPGVLTVGAQGGFARHTRDYNWGGIPGSVEESWTLIETLGRVEYHLQLEEFPEALDLYGALAVGPGIVIYDNDNDDYNPDPDPHFNFSPRVGMTYYVANNFGLFAETGYDISFLTVGLDFKF
jgi:hypothetical protein